MFVQILWDRISVKAKLLVWACLKKKKKRKENIMGLRKDKIPLVGFIFLLGLPLNTETLTLEIVTCKLLLL